MGLASLTSVRVAVIGAAVLSLVGVPSSAASAQDAYPKVEVRQLAGAGSRSWGSSARVKLDRDAFVVVIELGVDGRARVVFPESPREKAFVRADRILYVPLPSADVMFIRTQRMRTPTIVAFASDVAPDLSEFTDKSSRWDYQYALDFNGRTEDAVRDLATLIYGDPNMPYSVSESHIAPMLSYFAQNVLIDCGYVLGGSSSIEFTNFLWDLYGPWSLNSGFPIGSRTQAFWNQGLLGSYLPFGLSGFSRFTSRGAWDRFGAGCGGLQRFQPFTIAILDPGSFNPYNAEGVDNTGAVVPPPKNRTGGDPRSTVDGVSLVPASPAAIARRANAVTTAVNSAQDNRAAPVREAHQDMIQRAEVARTIALLASGAPQGGVMRPLSRGARGGFGGSAGYGGAGQVTRSGTSMGGGSSTGLGGSASSGSSSAGSGSSSAGEAERGGSAGGGRAGSGGRTPPQ